MERIENIAGAGTADVNCVYKGFEFWIELKMLAKDGSFDMRPNQIAWHLRRKKAGSVTFVLARNATELRLFGLGDDFITWRYIFQTQKAFKYDQLLREILKYSGINRSPVVL